MPDPGSYQGMGWVLVAIASLLVIGNQGFKFFRNVTGKGREHLVSPQPLEVRAATQFVTKEEYEKHSAWDTQEHNNIFAKMGGMERGMRDALKEEASILHDRITEVAKQNAAQGATQDLMNQRMMQMDGKLDRLIERQAPGGAWTHKKQ